jgi:hypothetical protein
MNPSNGLVHTLKTNVHPRSRVSFFFFFFPNVPLGMYKRL